ncbi:class I SAM-dependent methyltransferase [Streptomyces sp. NPDC058964]|uniref:class I SAM-dependent methyltransferase n=1 Tax=Streptomyces sp. NPDC058964 TaxID=3346681 RepID=UPI0036C986CF
MTGLGELTCVGECMTETYFDLLDDLYDEYRPVDVSATRAEIDLVLAAADAEGGDRALDLMCGQGRHSIELARRGWHVTALDRLPSLLGVLADRAETHGLSGHITTRTGDVHTVDLPPGQSLSLMLGNSFGFAATREQGLRLLKRIGAALRPDGVLSAEIFTPERRSRRTRWHHTFPAGSVAKHRTWHPGASSEHMSVEICRGDTVMRTCYRQFTPDADEFTGLAARAGLSAAQVSAWPSDDSALFMLRRMP